MRRSQLCFVFCNDLAKRSARRGLMSPLIPVPLIPTLCATLCLSPLHGCRQVILPVSTGGLRMACASPGSQGMYYLSKVLRV